VSPVENGLIWVGSDDGLVHVTRDGGKTWSDVTPKGLPEWSKVSLIDASPHNAGTAYLAIDRHALDDFRPYIYKTADYGKTWTSITDGLRANDYVHAVREDTARKGLLFAGTETGVYASFDDGGHWQSLQLELPTVPVYDLIVHGDDLILATHGRGFWVLDDISPLRQSSSSVEADGIHLYSPAVAFRFRGGSSEIPKGRSLGANPPDGAIIDYSFKAEPKDAVTLEILDGGGKVIRKYSSKAKKDEKEAPDEDSESSPKNEQAPAAVGLNRFVWDLRYQPASNVAGIATWSGNPVGPLAVPGMYQVRLIAEGKTYTAPMEVKQDPRIQVSLEDLQKQFDLALKISNRVAEAHDAVNQIRDVRGQLAALKKRIGTESKSAEIVAAGDKLSAEMTAIEEAIIQPKSKSGEDPLNYPVRLADQMMALGHTVDSADAAPTQASNVVFEYLDAKIEEQVAKWKQIREKDLAELNARIRGADIPAISMAPAKRSDSQ
jgi:hypothetical protein